MIQGTWPLFSFSACISVKQETMAGYFNVHNHPGVLKIVNMNGNRDILLTRISRGANNCAQRAFEKKIIFNYFSPHFKFVLSNERLYFCYLKKIKDQKD